MNNVYTEINAILQEQKEGMYNNWGKYGVDGVIGAMPPISQFANKTFAEASAKCANSCQRRPNPAAAKACTNLCHATAAAQVIAKLRRDINQVRNIGDQRRRIEVQKRFQDEIRKWMEKANKYRAMARQQSISNVPR